MPDDRPTIAPPPVECAAEDEVAPPPPTTVQSTLYITPDGRVHFGALFQELVPVARALDATSRSTDP